MTREVPGKVKICAYLMYLSAVLTVCAACAMLGYIAAIPTMMEASMQTGSPAEAEAAMMTMQVGLAVGSCFVFLFALLYGAVGYGLMNLQGWARIATIVLSVLNLCSFPIGTLIGGFMLYVMFADEESVKAFS